MGTAVRVFVYGTLRRGYALHSLLRGPFVRWVGKGWIRGKLYDLGDYPGVVGSSSADSRVEGEVYELLEPETQLRVLDDEEDYHADRPEDSLFVRRETQVQLEDGRRLNAWAYYLPKKPSSARLIPGGDYAESHPPRS